MASNYRAPKFEMVPMSLFLYRFISNDVEEISCFLMRVTLRNFISLFTGEECKVTLKIIAQNKEFQFVILYSFSYEEQFFIIF